MSRPLLGVKIAVLVANGFHENDLTAIQKPLIQAGANIRIISSEHGLVHSWNGDGWGHHYAIDANLGAALGSDYAMLVIPGGARSMEKLKLTAHTKRFIGNFLAASKPVAVCGEAAGLADFAGDNVLTDPCADEDGRKRFAARVLDFFTARATIGQETVKAA